MEFHSRSHRWNADLDAKQDGRQMLARAPGGYEEQRWEMDLEDKFTERKTWRTWLDDGVGRRKGNRHE
ncbi:hypothetical protein GJ744_007061 [Endocarpon pusillum]|uniref:Uncharacterized protein n=1 Tax=Endocarpon pusillum TaxID=364733 RepID=A0A8H7E5K6_9EURO|nr:hypothetical protein GJ744_007061 [Endocarpon pusillum]